MFFYIFWLLLEVSIVIYVYFYTKILGLKKKWHKFNTHAHAEHVFQIFFLLFHKEF